MDVTHINPFIQSFDAILPQLGFGSTRRGTLSVREHQITFTGVVIVVGIVGSFKGNAVYCLEYDAAKKIASNMMMGMPVDELDEMAKSALSELSNMLTATAATNFSENGVSIDISTPTVLSGENITVKMSSAQVLSIPLFADDIPVEINIACE
jgi:chemotaxis protein CheX